MWEGRNGVHLKLNYPPCLPLQVPSWPGIRVMLKEGKRRIEGPPVGDEVYNICICLEMP